MGRFRVLWTIIRLFITSKTFRAFMVEKLKEWSGTPMSRGKTSPRIPVVPEEQSAKPRRRAVTTFLPENRFTTIAPESEKKSTGTLIADKGEVDAELARRGWNPDETRKRSE